MIKKECMMETLDNPYVSWGHQVLPGERCLARTMAKRKANALLRKDLWKFCAIFCKFGHDSLLLSTPAYNVDTYRLWGNGKILKSTLIRKLGYIDREYIAFCNYKGKHTSCYSNGERRSCDAVHFVTWKNSDKWNSDEPATSSEFFAFSVIFTIQSYGVSLKISNFGQSCKKNVIWIFYHPCGSGFVIIRNGYLVALV